MKNNISVVIPTNGRNYSLTKCVESIFNQTVLPGEIVIIDNTFLQTVQKTVLELSKISPVDINYFWEPRKGASFARNLGIKKSNCDILAFIDDDCIASSNWIEQMLAIPKSKRKFIHMGKNLNGLPNNLFSCVEYYLTEGSINKVTYSLGKTYYSKFLDTKNFFAEKSFLLKNELFFDEKNPPFYPLENDRFSLKLINKKIPIIIHPKITIHHYGSESLIQNFKHQFRIGSAYYDLLKNFKNQSTVRKFIIKNVSLNRKDLDKFASSIRKRILKNKGVFFRLFFKLLVRLDLFIPRLGYGFQAKKK